MEREVVWTKGSKFTKTSAKYVHQALEAIRMEKGRLKAADVVYQATEIHKKHGTGPLEDLFEWNDEKAAIRDRFNTARLVIRSLQTREGKKEPMRIYSAVALPGERSKSYRPLEELLKNRVYRRTLLAQAQMEYARVRRKYAQLQELAAIHVAVDEQIGRAREQAEHRRVVVRSA